jgi:hypothetical protein
MTAIAQYLTDDHHHCDALFAEAEGTVAAGDRVAARARFEAFRLATLTHLAREEEVLFPDQEEQILYPMADEALAAQAPDLVARMRRKG